jgi:hypothetical protein
VNATGQVIHSVRGQRIADDRLYQRLLDSEWMRTGDVRRITCTPQKALTLGLWFVPPPSDLEKVPP